MEGERRWMRRGGGGQAGLFPVAMQRNIIPTVSLLQICNVNSVSVPLLLRILTGELPAKHDCVCVCVCVCNIP